MTKEEKIELWKQQIAELERNIKVLSKSTIEPKEGDFLYSETEEVIFKVTKVNGLFYYCERCDLELSETYYEEGYSIEKTPESEYQFPHDIEIISKETMMKIIVNRITTDWAD